MKTAKYRPVAIEGTSNADHLNCQITHCLKDGYSSKASAERAWYRACRKANGFQIAMGLSPMTRPECRVEVVR